MPQSSPIIQELEEDKDDYPGVEQSHGQLANVAKQTQEATTSTATRYDRIRI
jgi:hypothetical protein